MIITSKTHKKVSLDGLNLEMKTNERKDQTLDVLNKIVEASETLGILAIVDIDKRSDLGRSERDVFVAHDDFKLLTTDSVWRWPQLVVLLHDLRVLDDSLQLVHHSLVHVGLFADQRVVLVVRVVGVAEFAVRAEFELEELVAEFAFVAYVVAQIEVTRHCSKLDLSICLCSSFSNIRN